MNRRTFFSSLLMGVVTLPTLAKATIADNGRFIAYLRASPIDCGGKYQWVIPSLQEILGKSAYGQPHLDTGRALSS